MAYISLDNLVEAIGEHSGFCNACLTGEYPTKVTIDTERARVRNASIESRSLAPAKSGV